MQPRPSYDRELLILIAVSAVLILGLGLFLFTNYRSASPTAIPSDVGPIETATQPSLPSPTSDLEETPRTATETSPAAYPGPPAETLPAASTLVTETQPAPTATATRTPDLSNLLAVGKYDNTHPGISYDRFWAFKMNPGTKNAYKGTLHVSSSIWSEASFTFTGQRFYFGYQRGRSFGVVTVIIDGQTYSFHEQAFGNVWRSPELTPGIHSVIIIHESGQSINLDYIEIVG